MENLNFNINGKTYEIAINPNSTVELEAGFASGSGIATFASIAVNNNFEKKPVDNLTKVTITSTLFEGEKVFSNYQLQNSYNLAMKLFAENIGDPLTSLIGHEVTITQEFKLSDGQTYTNTNTIKFTDNYKLQDPILEKTTAKKAEIIDVELLDAKSYMLTAQLTNAEYKNVKSVRFDYALDEYLVDEDNTIAPGFKDDEETDDYTKILFNDEKGIAKYVIIEFDDNTRLKLNIPEY